MAYHDDDIVMIHPRNTLIRKARRCVELRFQRCVVTCLCEAWSQVRRMLCCVRAQRRKWSCPRAPCLTRPAALSHLINVSL
jgi:hypothetical protein